MQNKSEKDLCVGIFKGFTKKIANDELDGFLTGAKPLCSLCDFCEKGFTQADHLTKHKN